MKTQETKCLEMTIWNATKKPGLYGCFEVTIGFGGKERIDFMTYDTKGTFRCYEIKVTKSDFHSSCQNSFVGHLNYYILPLMLFEEVSEEIPAHIGVYVERNGIVYNVKKAKRCQVDDPEVLKDSLIRSLYREAAKKMDNENPLHLELLNRTISQLTREMQDYRGKYWNLLHEVQERYGTRWNRDQHIKPEL